jgi:hypothetical protein
LGSGEGSVSLSSDFIPTAKAIKQEGQLPPVHRRLRLHCAHVFTTGVKGHSIGCQRYAQKNAELSDKLQRV